MSAKLKVIIVGNSGVGKTCFFIRLVNEFFPKKIAPTIGALYQNILIIDENGNKIYLDMWDTAGQEMYRSLMPLYFRNTNMAIIMYSVIEEYTFENIDKWILEVKEYSMNKCKNYIIIGNMIDLYDENPEEYKSGYNCRLRKIQKIREQNMDCIFCFYEISVKKGGDFMGIIKNNLPKIKDINNPEKPITLKMEKISRINCC